MSAIGVGAAGVDLGLHNGATLAGVFGSLVLYGASILQTFIYYLSYPDDRAWKKLLVAIVFLLETVHSVLACAGIWNWLIQNFGNFANIEVLHPTILIPIIIACVVAFVVKTYFVWRIRCLSTGRFKQIFPAVMMPLITAFLALGCCERSAVMVPTTNNNCRWADYTAKALMTPILTVLADPVLTKVGYASLGISAAVDVIIATAMFVLLAKGRDQFNKHTDRILFRWTLISIHTGFWTALFAVLTIILYATYPSNSLYTITYFPLCELYCNTLLANFNARSWVRSSHVPPVSLSRRRPDKLMAAAVPLPPLEISIEASKRIDSESCENKTSTDIPCYV
ncbi:hypothetical protein PAXINDRAFT_20494 [Paxillus involutus ATCC 200175]|uniref:DUF6534 domain-containing protein n=1 Tax=Paxillus involutus ATCC 200175 TaxID=664439 RepID=A0A0C9SMJ9_PAXIN|nr:hypothetical protein PAXINDRAFT_20494 [Paxillus involutus ATCC 200175]